MTMSPYLQGMAAGSGLIIAIGAQNAFVLTQGVKKQHNLLVAAICWLCDVLLIFTGAAGVGAAVATEPLLREGTAWAGAAFLFYYGGRSLKSAVTGNALHLSEEHYRSRWTVSAAALAVTLLNPHVYLDTVVLLGGISGQFSGQERYLFACGAGSASFVWFFSLSLGGTALSPLFQKKAAWRVLDALVCLTLWSIAVQLLPI